MYQPKHLTKWQHESHYGGDDLSEWYILYSHTRDSYLLQDNNFESIKKHLNEQGFEIAGSLENGEEGKVILLAGFGHWACGWIESLMIHQSNDAGLMLGDEIKAAIADYPIFDEDSYCMAELEMIFDYVKEYVVKEWLDNQDMEYTDSLLEYVTIELTRSHDFELNGYDEVINSSQVTDEEIESLVDRYNHLTTCPNCQEQIDNRSESCSCQMNLL